MAEIAPFAGCATTSRASATPRACWRRPTTSSARPSGRTLEARDPHNVVRLELPRGEGDARYGAPRSLLRRLDWPRAMLRRDAAPGDVPLRAAVHLGRARRTRAQGFIAAAAARAVREARGAAPRAHAVGAQGGSPQADARDAHAHLAGVRAVPRSRRRRRGRARPPSTAARPRSTRPPPTATRTACGSVTDAGAIDAPGAAAARQAGPDRRRPPPLRDHGRLRDELRAAGRARPARAAPTAATMFLARAEDPGPAGAADAPPGARTCRRSSCRRSCRGARAPRSTSSRATRRRPQAIEARLAQRPWARTGAARGIRACAPPASAATDLARAQADRRPVGAGAARAARRWT